MLIDVAPYVTGKDPKRLEAVLLVDEKQAGI
jgi:hypothetical protein